MHPARGLKAWDAADRLADEVRAAIAKVRRGRQRYKLIDQLCRSADAISLHISEGSGRKTVADQVHFYVMGRSSAQEVLTAVKRARRARLFDDRTYYRLANLATVTHNLTSALIRKLGG